MTALERNHLSAESVNVDLLKCIALENMSNHNIVYIMESGNEHFLVYSVFILFFILFILFYFCFILFYCYYYCYQYLIVINNLYTSNIQRQQKLLLLLLLLIYINSWIIENCFYYIWEKKFSELNRAKRKKTTL